MRRWLASTLVVALGGLGACGGDDEDERTATWPGPPPDAAGARAAVADFNDLIEAESPDWARTPLMAAAAFAGDRPRTVGEGGTELSVLERRPEREGERSVALTEDRLPDDSVRAVRWTLRFERAGDGGWRLLEARRTQRCQAGRGHQRFSAEPCV